MCHLSYSLSRLSQHFIQGVSTNEISIFFFLRSLGGKTQKLDFVTTNFALSLRCSNTQKMVIEFTQSLYCNHTFFFGISRCEGTPTSLLCALRVVALMTPSGHCWSPFCKTIAHKDSRFLHVYWCCISGVRKSTTNSAKAIDWCRFAGSRAIWHGK